MYVCVCICVGFSMCVYVCLCMCVCVSKCVCVSDTLQHLDADWPTGKTHSAERRRRNESSEDTLAPGQMSGLLPSVSGQTHQTPPPGEAVGGQA